ncbi:MAG: iron-containing alcohol dehydrogenase [Chloroflexota bacterium]|nr:iron-containing alcohol dehydrogenase [Chloroflexota bacterium]
MTGPPPEIQRMANLLDRWTYRTTPTVVYGRGCLDELPDHVRRIADGPALIVTDKGLVEAGVVERVTDELARAGIDAEVWDEAEPEPPTDSVDACAQAIRQANPAVVLGLGGGSAMDTSQIAACVVTNGGKAEDWIGVEVVRKPGVPTISIPTTAGTASEVTGNAVMVLPDRSNKLTVVSPFIYPQTALIDPALTDSVPSHITAATGMDTFCHAAESFITRRATQHTRQPAADALRRTLEFLPRAVADGSDREARDQMSYACLQAGYSLANAGVILVHGLAHAIGARARIPHGVANTVCLLPVMRLAAEHNPALMAELADPLGVPADTANATDRAQAAVAVMERLVDQVGLPTKLRDVGVERCWLPDVAAATLTNTRVVHNSPVQPNAAELTRLLEGIFAD